jgi:MFS family permease
MSSLPSSPAPAFDAASFAAAPSPSRPAALDRAAAFEPAAAAPSHLSREQKRNLALASLGSLLEFYEFMVFGFFTVIIGKLFFPPGLPDAVKTFQAFALYSLGFALRPLAGAIIGHLGDKFGRKKLFMLTVFMMAVPTTLIGLMPTYAAIGSAAALLLLLLRLVQGVAIAGEFAGASVFVIEHVPASRLATATGCTLGASYVGFFLGAGSGALMAALLSPVALESWGWRVPFLIGGLFGLAAVYLRRRLDETPLFKEISLLKRRASAPLKEVLRGHMKALAYDALLSTYLGMMIILLYFYMPSFLQTQYGFGRQQVFNANTGALLLLALVCPLWGRLADRIGCAWVLAIGAAGLTADLALFFQHLDQIAADPGQLTWWWLSFSVFMGTAAVVPALSAIVFPTEVRFSGFGLGYNAGIVISASAPAVMSWLVLSHGKTAVSGYAVALGVLGLLLAAWTPRLKKYARS